MGEGRDRDQRDGETRRGEESRGWEVPMDGDSSSPLYQVHWLALRVNLTHAGVISKKGTSGEEMPS